jgi:cytochrome c oxidase subunit 1
VSLLIKREPAEANPWHSKSPEWQLPTPVPVYDFERIPVFGPDPYPYGAEPAGIPAVAAPVGGTA